MGCLFADFKPFTRKALSSNQSTFNFITITGNSTATAYDVYYPNPVNSLGELISQQPQFNYVSGDGTVPVVSGEADTTSVQYIYTGRSEHQTMLSDEELVRGVIDMLRYNHHKKRSSMEHYNLVIKRG